MAELKAREEMNPEYFWKLEDLYMTDEDFLAALEQIRADLKQFASYKGTCTKSAEQLYRVLSEQDRIQEEFERAYVYANQKMHQDTANQKYQGFAGKAQAMSGEMLEVMSFVEPEEMTIPEEVLKRWMEEYRPLRHYDRMLSEKFRMREHILSQEMEEVLARVSDLSDAPQQIFRAMNNADLTFGTILDENGKEVVLTHGNHIKYMESVDRFVRRQTFQLYYKTYQEHNNTIAAIFAANLKQAAFHAKVRKYPSALAAALDGGNIPLSVYDRLISAVHEKLPAMYSYVALRKKILRVEELHMYDVYAPLAEKTKADIPYEEAKEIVKQGLSVMGEEYVSLLEEGFQNHWIDVYENKGKQSGAYSWGAYGCHPYVLLNYSGTLDSVFTLAHEMGHSIHTYYSSKNQSYTYAGYRIFVAEVASTCNEALLIRYLLQNSTDPKEKAYLINHFLEEFKGTVYRQTMFAEFEKLAHEMYAREGTVTAGALNDLYRGLNQQYFGPDMITDPQIAYEWSRIPHFYTPFYVYQYATGFSAAIAISSKILAGEPGILERYKEFLSGGNSKDPIDLLKICGVDMTSPEPVRCALDVFAGYVQELADLQK